MQQYIVRRLLLFVPTLLGVVFGIFVIMRVIPGDPALVLLSGEGNVVDPKALAALRHKLGTDKPLVVQLELLGTGVELDPARAEVEAACRLLDRLLGQVEPHERDQTSARALGVGERAVVGRAERRVTVDLVHAEHEAARDPVVLVGPLEVLVDPGHAVDVVTEVDVRVEDLGALGQLAHQLFVVAGDQRLRLLEHVLHDLRV